MMKTVIVSCRTLEDEVNVAKGKCGCTFPVKWIESGLHNTPKKLTARLQTVLDDIDADRILLAMGYCGNSLIGLHTGNSEVIVPRVDDCISLLLGSTERRKQLSEELSAYYMTSGWFRGERNICVEYQYTVDKYGQEAAESIMDMMYCHYSTLALLDNGVYPIEQLEEQTKEIAKILHLKQTRVLATLDFICDLLTGPWTSKRFLVMPPAYTVTIADLTLNM